MKVELTEEQGEVLFGHLKEEEPIQQDAVAEVAEQVVETQKDAPQEEVVGEESPVGEPAAEKPNGDESKEEVVAEIKAVPQVEAEKDEEVEEEEVAKAKVVKRYKDEKHAAINKFIEENGTENLRNFLDKYDSNIESLSDEKILALKIENENQGRSREFKDTLLKRKLEEYNLDSDDDGEIAFGTELLKRDADLYREQLEREKLEIREKYKADLEELEQNQVEEQGPTEAELAEQREAMRSKYAKELTPFIKDGVLKLKDSEGEINIPFKNPDDLVNAAMNPAKFISDSVVSEDGVIDYATFAEIAAFIKDKNRFKSELIKYGKSIGSLSMTETIKNATPIGKGTQADEMVEMSPITHPQEFLKAMQAQIGRR